jgi:phosphoglycerol transferase
MDPEFLDEIDPSYVRTNYNCIINAAVEPACKTDRQFGSFDLFPTTLAAMGVEIKGDRLALGTNLFSDTPTLTEQYGYDFLNEELQKESDYYDTVFFEP